MVEFNKNEKIFNLKGLAVRKTLTSFKDFTVVALWVVSDCNSILLLAAGQSCSWVHHWLQLKGRVLLVPWPHLRLNIQNFHLCLQLLPVCQWVLRWIPEPALREGDEPSDPRDEPVRGQVRCHPRCLLGFSPLTVNDPLPSCMLIATNWSISVALLATSCVMYSTVWFCCTEACRAAHRCVYRGWDGELLEQEGCSGSAACEAHRRKKLGSLQQVFDVQRN